MASGQQLSWAIAFLGGVVSFLSPCVLPMFPAYISYLTGASLGDMGSGEWYRHRRVTVYRSLAFIIGFTLVFVLLGATASLVGKLLGQHRYLLQRIGGVIIFLFGLHLAGLLPLKFLYYEKRITLKKEAGQGFTASVLMGMAFAAGWSPCVGPILSGILLYAGSSSTVGQGMVLLLMYSLGLSLPFFITALAIHKFLPLLGRFSPFLPYVSAVGGGLLMLMGLLVFTNQLAQLNQYFLLPELLRKFQD
ncbi:MAG TPA: cytochrome c biogenesis protein CcdA [Bacillota bacterium]|nr:cytochrome c biogenesis protein CcdA [Bacillota bacterium]